MERREFAKAGKVNFDGFKARLDARGVKYRENHIPQPPIDQLFCPDNNNVMVPVTNGAAALVPPNVGALPLTPRLVTPSPGALSPRLPYEKKSKPTLCCNFCRRNVVSRTVKKTK